MLGPGLEQPGGQELLPCPVLELSDGQSLDLTDGQGLVSRSGLGLLFCQDLYGQDCNVVGQGQIYCVLEQGQDFFSENTTQ